MNQIVEYMDRPPSEQLVDLHVYLVPVELWRKQLNSAVNTVIQDTVSKGFIRVLPEMKIYDLRAEVESQLGADIIPSEYVFLKSVGRCLTQVKAQQELTLKVKHFLPPHAYQPEIFLLEATADVKALAHESPRGLSSYSDGPWRARPHPGTNYPGTGPYPGAGQYPNGPVGPNGQYPGTETGYPGMQPGRYSQPNTYDYNKNFDKVQSQRSPPGGAGVDGRSTVIMQIKDSHATPQSSHSTQTGDDLLPQPYSHKPDERQYLSPPRLVPSTPSQDEILALPDSQSPGERTPSPTVDQSTLPPSHPKPLGSEEPLEKGSDNSVSQNSVKTSPPQSHPKTPITHITSKLPTRENARKSALPPGDGVLSPMSATPPPLPLDSQGGNQGQLTARSHDRSHDARNTHTSNTADDSGISEPTPDDQEFRREASGDSIERQKARVQDENDKNNQYGQRPDNQDLTQKWVEDDTNRRASDPKNSKHDQQTSDRSTQGVSHRDPEAWQENGQPDKPNHSNKQFSNHVQEDGSGGGDEFPSPPLLDLESGDSEAVNQARLEERDKLLEEIEQARQERNEAERKREELVRRAKAMQTKTNNRRSQARDMWKKKYFDEKKKTGPLEDESARLRNEVDMLHRKLMAQLEVNKDKTSKKTAGNPSIKNNYKIQATKLIHDNDELKRKVETAKVKLTAEMKLRNQAETELRALRAELSQKKINVNLVRTQQLAALGGTDITPRTPRITPRS